MSSTITKISNPLYGKDLEIELAKKSIEKTTELLQSAINTLKTIQLDWLHEKSAFPEENEELGLEAFREKAFLSGGKPFKALPIFDEAAVESSIKKITALAPALIQSIEKKKASKDQIDLLSSCYEVTGDTSIRDKIDILLRNLDEDVNVRTTKFVLKFFFSEGWEASSLVLAQNTGLSQVRQTQKNSFASTLGLERKKIHLDVLTRKLSNKKITTLWVRHLTFQWLVHPLRSKHSSGKLRKPSISSMTTSIAIWKKTLKGMCESDAAKETIANFIKGQPALQETFKKIHADKEPSEMNVYQLILFMKEKMLSEGYLWTQGSRTSSEVRLEGNDLTFLDDSFFDLSFFDLNEALWHELTFWESKPNLECMKLFLESGSKYFELLARNCVQRISADPIALAYFKVQMENDFLGKNLVSKESILGMRELSKKQGKGRALQYLKFLRETAYAIDAKKSSLEAFVLFRRTESEFGKLENECSSLGLRWEALKEKRRIQNVLRELIEASEGVSGTPKTSKKARSSFDKKDSKDFYLGILDTIFVGLLLEEPLAEELYTKIQQNSAFSKYKDDRQFDFAIKKIEAALGMPTSEPIKVPDELQRDERFNSIYRGDLEIVLLFAKTYRNSTALTSFPQELIEDLQSKIDINKTSDEEKMKQVDAVITFFKILLNTPGNIPTNPALKKEIQKTLKTLSQLVQENDFLTHLVEDCQKLLKTIENDITGCTLIAVPVQIEPEECLKIIYKGDIQAVSSLAQGYRKNTKLDSFHEVLVKDLKDKIDNSKISKEEKIKQVNATLTFFKILFDNPSGMPTRPSIKKGLKETLEILNELIEKNDFLKSLREDCQSLVANIQNKINENKIRSALITSASTGNLRASNTLTASKPFEWVKGQDSQTFLSELKAFYVEFFLKIHPSEFDMKGWNDDNAYLNAPNIKKFIELCNQLTFYSADAILSQESDKDCSDLMKKIINTAELALSENYYDIANFLFAVFIGPVGQLPAFKKLDEGNYKAKLEKLEQALSAIGNYSSYRKRLDTYSGKEFLPLLPVHLTELTFTLEGNPSIFSADDDQGRKGELNIVLLKLVSNTKDLLYEKQKLLTSNHTSLSPSKLNTIHTELSSYAGWDPEDIWAIYERKSRPNDS